MCRAELPACCLAFCVEQFRDRYVAVNHHSVPGDFIQNLRLFSPDLGETFFFERVWDDSGYVGPDSVTRFASCRGLKSNGRYGRGGFSLEALFCHPSTLAGRRGGCCKNVCRIVDGGSNCGPCRILRNFSHRMGEIGTGVRTLSV